ncbi:ligase-associated DNA damage response exonuclease [Paracoccus aerodenitrificans]|uniref:ligase-associated DNA damage response exonuclease n=1 Tax=Paracoccus aerodenitrificans TaxID=3017781 RepID=UPI0022EFE85F|nr:ligase-associated DNA damage response exonuclease [Paracoccus aerodenitrificans]WBU64973.1 ligase-associated DNA damage response exonuclease [Paracoccus aerodenitrificans]
MTRRVTPLVPKPAGLYCAAGDFFIDPVRPVSRALITHGHADHARAGHGSVLATRQTLDIMAIRYGEDFTSARQEAEGEMRIGDAVVSFHPAGHVLGSAQISVTAEGQRVTVSGDYARVPNASCAPWQPVPCDIFVTEATFGLPVFRHPDPRTEIAKLLESVRAFPERAHLIGAYSLGKAQRVIMLLREAGWDAPVYIHGALQRLCDYHIAQGIPLGDLRPATTDSMKKTDFAGQIIIAPPSAFEATWAQRFPDPVIAFASGWMSVRARARQRGVELPLVISDHVDWPDLTRTIEELDPAETWVTHGREDAVIRWCELQGRAARPLHLAGYEDEAE